MKQETKGKIFVGIIISVLAFGFATGTGIFIGTNPFNSAGVVNLTNQGEFPNIYTTPYVDKNKTNTTKVKPIKPESIIPQNDSENDTTNESNKYY
ncbi:MAG: hypothetical protein PHY59_04900 [Methanobacterium sp.]|nr:hypothetical protein [Methanobacterium sp.]